uniref:uncharacterized protein LOC104265992 n=1 Tax=Ciona intestinalis TaxID=7719 RepID=UPI00052193AE|nr:uncharacterized protein LOC104265992 [Ciona intestinalis]|eukprot:XP_009859555.1 uncharacterized protein LOC104265992 [Ciona intestinalis]
MRGAWLAFIAGLLNLSATIAYRDAFYCRPSDLGICASRELEIRKQHCVANNATNPCHTISSITLHDAGKYTHLKHCGVTISICQKVQLKAGKYLLCRSECNKAVKNGKYSVFNFILLFVVTFVIYL